MLGMGEDGHVASIFPGSYEAQSKNMVTALKKNIIKRTG